MPELILDQLEKIIHKFVVLMLFHVLIISQVIVFGISFNKISELDVLLESSLIKIGCILIFCGRNIHHDNNIHKVDNIILIFIFFNYNRNIYSKINISI